MLADGGALCKPGLAERFVGTGFYDIPIAFMTQQMKTAVIKNILRMRGAGFDALDFHLSLFG
jgi:hypothetical protein